MPSISGNFILEASVVSSSLLTFELFFVSALFVVWFAPNAGAFVPDPNKPLLLPPPPAPNPPPETDPKPLVPLFPVVDAPNENVDEVVALLSFVSLGAPNEKEEEVFEFPSPKLNPLILPIYFYIVIEYFVFVDYSIS